MSNISDDTINPSRMFYDFPAFRQAPFTQSALRQQCRLTGSYINDTYLINVPCVLGVQYSGPFMREIQNKIRTGRTVRIIDLYKLDDESLGGSRTVTAKTSG